jgi:hypothetical protein
MRSAVVGPLSCDAFDAASAAEAALDGADDWLFEVEPAAFAEEARADEAPEIELVSATVLSFRYLTERCHRPSSFGS